MEYIEEEYRRVKLFEDTFDVALNEAILSLNDEICNTIKNRWLNGESVNGGTIKNKGTGKGYSSLSYEHMKIQINSRAGGNVDLTLTGALADGLTIIRLDDGSYTVISLDSKYTEIGNKYGFEEFGLNKQESDYFKQRLEIILNEHLNK